MSEKSQEWKRVNIIKEQYDFIEKLVKIPYIKVTCSQNVSGFTRFAIGEKIKEIVDNLKDKITVEEYSELFSQFSKLNKE
jgi:hypothetical protein